MRKNIVAAKAIVSTIILVFIFNLQSNAQCSVASTNGYVVNVSITPKTIVVSNPNCQWGYNYNVGFDYAIAITGPGAAPQYTLQALIRCVNNQINGAYSLPLGGGSGTAITTTNPSIPHNGTAYGYNSPYVHCASATVATMQCNSVDLIIQGPGIPYQVINCAIPVTPPTNLPVEFLYFDGEKQADGNLLTWAVQSEYRNDFFTIETSTDGENWKEFTKVKGAGTAQEAKTYSFLDTKSTRQSTYYKLSQTDLDGSRNELALKFIPADNFEFRLYPNPSSDSKVHVDFSNTSDEAASVIVRNELGQVVFTANLEYLAKSGKTTYYSSDLDLGQPAGVYFVEIHSGDQLLERSKLVIR